MKGEQEMRKNLKLLLVAAAIAALLSIAAYADDTVTPADVAGILAGDIIVEADGTTITSHQQLVGIVLSQMVGDELKVKIYRDGEYLDLTIVLANKTDMNFNDVVGGSPSPLPEEKPTPKP